MSQTQAEYASKIAAAVRAIAPDAKLLQDEVTDINSLAGKFAARDVPAAGVGQTASAASSSPTGRKTGQKGINLMHSFEQCRLAPYKDPGSRDGLPITAGWGTTVDEGGGPIPLGVNWTQEKADKLFARDLAKFEKAVNDAVGSAPTTQDQFDALVSLAYNIGAGAMAGSTVIRRHKAKDYEGAATAFGMWVKNDGAVMRGLVRRRAAEADLYRGRA